MRGSQGRRRRRRRLAATCVAICTVAGCSETPETGSRAAFEGRPDRVVDLDFEHEPADLGKIVPSITNESAAQVTALLTTEGTGHVVLANGVGGGYGLRFPAFDDAVPGAGVALVIRSDSVPDVLSPGRHDFGFGADFALDDKSDGDDRDNGNNLIQRGLTADAHQYKIQVDHGVPSCRVAGDDGEAFVKSELVVVPERWYRVRCQRTGDRVVLTVVPWDGGGWGAEKVASVVAPTGSVTFADSGAPMSIGAKVDAEGRFISSASDQFNGVADNVYFEVVR